MSAFFCCCFFVWRQDFLAWRATAPLYDYDEATYAKVTVDTLASGNIVDLTLSGHPWFDKPPLYFWLAMASVKLFGTKEFAFRLPNLLATIVCLFLTYLITKRLTGDLISAGVAFLILMFTPPFYMFAEEARLDSGVLMCILAIVYFWIRGLRKEQFLLWLFPLAAIGFLFKSVIVLLSVPILLIFSACYWQWAWLKNKHLWLGGAASLLIVAPWHIWETMRFGTPFWNDYLVKNVFQRSTSTITGTFSYADYVQALFKYNFWWTWALLGSIAVYIGVCFRPEGRIGSASYRHMLAPLCSALFMLGLFSIAHTHLIPYMMPIFPFVALFIGMLFSNLTSRNGFYPYLALFLATSLIATGICYFYSPLFTVPFPTVPDEAAVGKAYRSLHTQIPLYAIGPHNLETINYYAGTQTTYRAPSLSPDALIRGPFYAVMPTEDLPIIFYRDANNDWKCKYGDMTIVYMGPMLMLVYSAGDFPQL